MPIAYCFRWLEYQGNIWLDLKSEPATLPSCTLSHIVHHLFPSLLQEADPAYQQDCTYCLESFCVGEVIRELPCKYDVLFICLSGWCSVWVMLCLGDALSGWCSVWVMLCLGDALSTEFICVIHIYVLVLECFAIFTNSKGNTLFFPVLLWTW